MTARPIHSRRVALAVGVGLCAASNDIGLVSGCKRGSAMTFVMAASRTIILFTTYKSVDMTVPTSRYVVTDFNEDTAQMVAATSRSYCRTLARFTALEQTDERVRRRRR